MCKVSSTVFRFLLCFPWETTFPLSCLSPFVSSFCRVRVVVVVLSSPLSGVRCCFLRRSVRFVVLLPFSRPPLSLSGVVVASSSVTLSDVSVTLPLFALSCPLFVSVVPPPRHCRLSLPLFVALVWLVVLLVPFSSGPYSPLVVVLSSPAPVWRPNP